MDEPGNRRVLTLDLVPAPGTTAVPPLDLPHFDPADAAYRVARTEALPLPERARAVREERADRTDASWPWIALVAALALAAVAAALVLARRGAQRSAALSRPPHEPSTPSAPRIGPGDVAAAPHERRDAVFAAFLAQRLGCSVGAVVDPSLAARLERHGVPADVARSAAHALEACVAERYGGPCGPDASALASLAAHVDRAVTPPGAGRTSG
jgi:hypothetical protein